MKLLKHNPLLFALTLSLPVANTQGAEAVFCTDYALSAIAQYWQSVDAKCGFNGNRWNADYKGQYEWCLTAHQWVAENETETRTQMLESCLKQQASAQHAQEQATNVADAADHSSPINEQLLQAVAENNVSGIEASISKGADPDFVTKDMALIKQLDMSYQLGKGVVVKGGAGADISGNKVNGALQGDEATGQTPLSLAISKGLVEAGEWLLQHSQEAQAATEATKAAWRKTLLGNALIAAVQKDDITTVKQLLDKGASVSYELDQNFGTPLYFAVMRGNLEISQLLLDNGADVRYTTNGGQNMLNMVLENLPLLTLLLEKGANPDSPGEVGSADYLPIIVATQGGHVNAVELLASYGAKVDIERLGVKPPLLIAIDNNNSEAVAVLLKSGANPNMIYTGGDSLQVCLQGEENRVPYELALKKGSVEILKLLKQAGAKPLAELCPASTGPN